MRAERKTFIAVLGISSLLGFAVSVPAFITAVATPVDNRSESLNYSPVVTQVASPVLPSARASSGLAFPGSGTITQTTDEVESPLARAKPALQAEAAPAPGLVSVPTTLLADIAVEADYAYFQKLGSDPVRAEAYARQLIAAVSDIYAREINVRLRVTYFHVSTSPNEPWTATTAATALPEVQAYWVAHGQNVQRATVLFLSGKSLGGGMSYRPGICSNDYGYAVAGDIQGTFSTQPGSMTWDLVVVAHELGHNFGSMHTHCYQGSGGSWYDECYNQENGCYSGAVVPSKGTLMSYCENNSPYMSNIDPLSFEDNSDPTIVNVMRATAEGATISQPNGCLLPLSQSAFIPLVGR